MISFVQQKDEPPWKGCFYAILMFAVSMAYTLFLHQYFHSILTFGMHMRTVLTASVFDKVKTLFSRIEIHFDFFRFKVLKLSNVAQKGRGVGETVNVMSTDVQRFQDTAFYLNMIVSNPYQVCI